MNPRIVSGIKHTAAALIQSADTTKTLNSSADNMAKVFTSIGKMSDEAASVKNKLIDARAKTSVEKMLGIQNSVANAEEKFRKELIDSQFSNIKKLFKRVHNSFIPAEFPSGTKINLKKSCMNEITNNALKGKETAFEYTNKNGETIKGFVSKKVQKQGEDCFIVQMHRIFGDACETVETRYYPKSSEIRSVGKKIDGQKTISIITGNESGGTLKANARPVTGSKLNIVSK